MRAAGVSFGRLGRGIAMLKNGARMSLAAALLCAGLAHAEPPKPATKIMDDGQYMTLQTENGKPRRCQVLRTYKYPAGGIAYDVKDVETGEAMTVIENVSPYHASSAKQSQPVATKSSNESVSPYHASSAKQSQPVATKSSNESVSPYHATDWTQK